MHPNCQKKDHRNHAIKLLEKLHRHWVTNSFTFFFSRQNSKIFFVSLLLTWISLSVLWWLPSWRSKRKVLQWFCCLVFWDPTFYCLGSRSTHFFNLQVSEFLNYCHLFNLFANHPEFSEPYFILVIFCQR